MSDSDPPYLSFTPTLLRQLWDHGLHPYPLSFPSASHSWTGSEQASPTVSAERHSNHSFTQPTEPFDGVVQN